MPSSLRLHTILWWCRHLPLVNLELTRRYAECAGELDNLRVRGARIVGTAAPKCDTANRVNILRGNTLEVKG